MNQEKLRLGHLVLALFLIAQGSCSDTIESSAKSNQIETDQVETGIIQAGRFGLRYRMEGRGRPTLVIGGSVYYPRVFSQNLRSHLRLVFLDHRGVCLPPTSPRDPAVDYELDKLIDDMELARKQLDLGRIVVIGHSGNSFMALEYAKKYPENVSHVVMIGIAPDLSEATLEQAEKHWQLAFTSWRQSVRSPSLHPFATCVLW